MATIFYLPPFKKHLTFLLTYLLKSPAKVDTNSQQIYILLTSLKALFFRVTLREPFNSHNLGISTNHISGAKKLQPTTPSLLDFLQTAKNHHYAGQLLPYK